MIMNEHDVTPELGDFLTHRHWVEALKLLNYQLERKKTNRHFRTLEMSYYEKRKHCFEKLQDVEYFDTRIANNLFYGLGKEFAVVPYTVPKSKLGLRRYKFMTCPMRVLYYAVGIYLLELSQTYLQDYKSNKHIHTGYGGNLGLNNKGEVILNPDRIYYRSHYENFCREIRIQNDGDTARKVVVRLDIQNYFDELNIPTLMKFLDNRVKPSVCRRMNFCKAAQAQIISFFDFVAGGKLGIPQSDNNIISDFIGHLFLVFGDLFLDEELRDNEDSVESYTIIRYVDDIFVSITFKEQYRELKTKFLNSLAPRIADSLHKELALRLNPKTRLFDLINEDDRLALERNLKLISQGNEIPDQNIAPPEEKMDDILSQLKTLQRFPVAPYFPEHRESDCGKEQFNEENFKDALKGVFDENVKQMLEMPKIKSRLKETFLGSGGFDFELANVYPPPIVILIMACADIRKEFRKFLLTKTRLSSSDIYLILIYLCQKGFSQDQLLEFLKKDPQMKQILDIFDREGLSSELPGYYALTEEQTLKIAQPHIVQQIRLRILAEQKENYSVALNHLLNEIQAICHHSESSSTTLRKYDVNNVVKFLTRKNVPNETKDRIRNLFDRRNYSPVSHPDPVAESVAIEEYEIYRNHVGICLNHLL